MTRELMQEMREAVAIARYQPEGHPFGKEVTMAYVHRATVDAIEASATGHFLEAAEHHAFAADLLQSLARGFK